MREIALIGILVVACAASLVSPRIGVLVYVWFAAARPDVAAYSTRPYFFVLAVVVALRSLPQVHQYANVLRSWITGGILLLQIPIALSIVFAYDPELCLPNYSLYLKVVVMCLLIPILVDDEVMIRRFLLVLALSLGFVAAKFGVWGLMQGGTILSAGYGGMIADTNGLALAMAMTAPLAWYAKELTTNRLIRYALWGITGLSAATVMMTGSRGNALALITVIGLTVLTSKRRLLTLTAITIVVIPMFLLIGNRFMDRMATLGDIDADQSASSRLVFADAAFRMWKDYPFFGVGFGQNNYVALSSRYLTEFVGKDLVVHNTYLQMLVDSGIFTFLIFVGTLYGSIAWLGISVRKTRQLRPDLVACPRALQFSLIAFAIGCTFYSRPAFEIYYIVLAGAAAWQLVSRKLLVPAPQTSSVPPVLPTMALPARPGRG